MKVLHLLASGGTGGIETLCKDYGCFSKQDNIFLFIWKGGTIEEEMQAAHLHVINLKASKKDIFGPWKYISNLCKTEKIQAVVVHHAAPVAHFYLMLLKRRFPHLLTVAYAHGNAVNMRGGEGNAGLSFKRKLIKMSLRRADLVIAISKSVRDSLVRYFGIDPRKIEIIYNGVNIQRFAQKHSCVHEQAQIIYVGRLIPQKGVDNTLRALAKIPSCISYHFSIVGDGSCRNELEKLTRELHLEDKVTFLGTKRNVVELLSDSDIFVHAPQLEEGFGITIVEAMAAGLLCVCTKSGAIDEIIEDSKSGILVEKDNIDKLSQAIMEAVQQNGTLAGQRMRQQARKRAECFSVQTFVSQLDEALEKKGQ